MLSRTPVRDRLERVMKERKQPQERTTAEIAKLNRRYYGWATLYCVLHPIKALRAIRIVQVDTSGSEDWTFY